MVGKVSACPSRTQKWRKRNIMRQKLSRKNGTIQPANNANTNNNNSKNTEAFVWKIIIKKNNTDETIGEKERPNIIRTINRKTNRRCCDNNLRYSKSIQSGTEFFYVELYRIDNGAVNHPHTAQHREGIWNAHITTNNKWIYNIIYAKCKNTTFLIDALTATANEWIWCICVCIVRQS